MIHHTVSALLRLRQAPWGPSLRRVSSHAPPFPLLQGSSLKAQGPGPVAQTSPQEESSPLRVCSFDEPSPAPNGGIKARPAQHAGLPAADAGPGGSRPMNGSWISIPPYGMHAKSRGTLGRVVILYWTSPRYLRRPPDRSSPSSSHLELIWQGERPSSRCCFCARIS